MKQYRSYAFIENAAFYNSKASNFENSFYEFYELFWPHGKLYIPIHFAGRVSFKRDLSVFSQRAYVS